MISSVAVVYWGGTCGTFVRQLLLQLMEGWNEDIIPSKNGSAHHFKSTRRYSNKKLSTYQTHHFIQTPELISKYQTVIAITVDPSSKEEFVIRTTNVILKYNLEKHENDINKDSLQYIPRMMNEYLGPGYEKLVDDIYDHRYDHSYHDIFVYFASKNLFLDDKCFFEQEVEMDGPVDGCVQLPFKTFLNGDVKTFTSVIEQAIKQPLTNQQRFFVVNNFMNYYKAQNILLFKNPYKYHALVSERARSKLESLQREFIHSSYNGR